MSSLPSASISSSRSYLSMPARSIFVPAGPKLPLMRSPVTRQARAVLFAHRRNLHSLESLVGQIVDHAHEADAGDADLNHLRKFLCWLRVRRFARFYTFHRVG